MKVRVNKILELCKSIQESSGEENPEVTYDAVMKALFPAQWKLDRYYDRHVIMMTTQTVTANKI